MSLQYVLYDYWEYGYAVGDAIIEDGSASITAQADVSAAPSRVREFAATVTGQADVAASPSRIQFSAAEITGIGAVEAQADRIRTSDAVISGQADVSALGGMVSAGQAHVTAESFMSAAARAEFAGNAGISAESIVVALGEIIGEEWVISPVTSNSWTRLDNQEYVVVDYWVDGYVDDGPRYWTQKSSTVSQWNSK